MLKIPSLKLWSLIFSSRVLFFAVLAIITFTAFDTMSTDFQLMHTECISTCIYSLNISMKLKNLQNIVLFLVNYNAAFL